MKLKKELGFIDVFCLATGAMISSGIFILPGVAFLRAGPAVFVSYFIAGLLALTGVFSVIELASAMPKAGGDYFFTTRSLGPLTGTVSGLLSWFALSLKTSFAMIGIGEILMIITGIPVLYTALGACVLFAILNIVGVDKAGSFEVLIVGILLAIVLAYIIIGLPHVAVANFEPFAPDGMNSVLLTAGFVFVSYGGLLKIATVSEEIKNPKRNIPLALLSSLFVVVVIYCLMLIVTVGTLPAHVMGGSLTPIADSAKTFMGINGFYLLITAAMLAFISTGNAGIMAASRYPLALSKDRLIPESIAYISKRFQSPVVAIVITAVLIAVSMLLSLETLVKAASTVIILSYILSSISVVILRESHVQNYRPSFMAPFYPWMQLISIICFSLLILDMGQEVLFISFGLVMAGVFFYFIYGHKNSNREYALLHLIARITDKEVRESSFLLEDELRTIIHARDDVNFDRFDRIVDRSIVIDLEESIDADSLFKDIARQIAKDIDQDEARIYDFLKSREAESSTAITPFTAIPHLIIEGKGHFNMILVRACKGITFSKSRDAVKSIFVLYGTRDERLFHLQALASIAQTILNPKFEERWLAAPTDQGIKDVIILSERRRIKED
jgi:amino acid transporter/mannitol/fructose-specific phosphotransferase system IIA component (Ntr-type)